MSSKSLKNIMNYKVFGDFGQALNKYGPIVTGIGQIYADSDKHWTNIRDSSSQWILYKYITYLALKTTIVQNW